MKFKSLSNYIEKFLTFCKRAAIDSYQPKSLKEALEALELSGSFTLDSAKSAHKKMVVKHHPDRGGDTETLQKINAAFEYIKTYLENGVEPKIDPKLDVDPYNLSYEDIAELRKEMGRDQFEKRFPGWLSELKSEMGLTQYNKIFEGYDSSYNPEDDEDYQRNQENLVGYVSSEIYDSIDLEPAEDSVTEEDLLWLMSNISETDDVLEYLQSLGAQVDKIRINKLLKHFNEKTLKKELRDLVEEKVKSFCKRHEKYKDVIKNVSLLDIIKDRKNHQFFDKNYHYDLFQLKQLITTEFLEFLKVRAQQKQLGFNKRTDLSKSRMQDTYLAGCLREHLSSQGFEPENSAIVDFAFRELKESAPNFYQKIIDIANPINYQ
jgi:curved DNA-binding protein CbpA